MSALNGLDIYYYSKHGVLHFLDVKDVQCLVGHVKDGDQWIIVDQSGTMKMMMIDVNVQAFIIIYYSENPIYYDLVHLLAAG